MVGLTLCGCSHDGQRQSARDQEQKDEGSAAFKAGKVAREVAKETGKVAAAAGRELEQSARKAHEGWKQQAREDQEKSRDSH